MASDATSLVQLLISPLRSQKFPKDALVISPSVTRALSSRCTGGRPSVITWTMANTIPPSTSRSGVSRTVLRTASLKSVMAIPPPAPPLPTSLLPRPPISLHPRPLISLLLLLFKRSFPHSQPTPPSSSPAKDSCSLCPKLHGYHGDPLAVTCSRIQPTASLLCSDSPRSRLLA